METEFLQRRIELLHSESQCNREDIARLTGELAHKVIILLFLACYLLAENNSLYMYIHQS